MERVLSRLTKWAPLGAALVLFAAISGGALAEPPARGALNKVAPKAAAAGPSLLPGASNHEPINIAADKLDYFDKEQKLIYTGNVVAVQGDSRLNASVLTIYLDKKPTGAAPAPAPATGPAGGSQVRRMEGKGPIAIVSKDQVGTGDALIYDKPENKFYLNGHVALSQGENVTRGDKLVYDLTTGQAVVSSAGRVRSLIVPGDQNAKPGTSSASPPAAPNKIGR
jgi:lipopolysaccharide export system protein LptA